MSFRIGQKLPERLEDIDGVAKSAILLLSLDEASASNLLRCLPQDVVQEVTAALATIEEVPNELIEGVIEEFYNLQLANRYVREGGLEYAKRLLRESLDPDRAAMPCRR